MKSLTLRINPKWITVLFVLGLTIIFVPGVAAQTADAPPMGTIVFQTTSGGPIYAVNADGANLRYLTTGLDPALSPDGQWVAFTRWDNGQDGGLGSLWVIKVDGSGERPILGDIRQPKAPTWSPDGREIVITMQHGGRLEPKRLCQKSPPPPYVFDKDDEYDLDIVIEGPGQVKFCYTLPPDPGWGLRVVTVATGEFEDLPHDSHSFSPTWDPANDWRLVYDGDRGLVNLDLNLDTTWALTEDVGDHSPAFSPDGSRIAVSYRQHDHWDIHLLNADGRDRVRLTQTPLRVIVEQRINGERQHSWNNAAPAWSPDGSQIAFLTDRTGRWEIWLMNADGSNQCPLLPAEIMAGLEIQYNSVDERVISWR
jgi:TolB protein